MGIRKYCARISARYAGEHFQGARIKPCGPPDKRIQELLRFNRQTKLGNYARRELGRVDPSRFKLPYRHGLQPHTPQLIRRNPPAEPLEHRFNATQLYE